MDEHRSYPLLGQLLLANGTVTPEELRAALHQQEETGSRLGEVLVQMGALAPRQLERALETQGRLRGSQQGPRPFVLLVDDDLEVGALVRDVLAGAGYRVGVAQNEAEVIAAVLAPDGVRPDLLVLDLGLPDHGGIELLTIIRKTGSTQDMPVVVLTGRADLESNIRARGLAISEFLVKPVPVRQLVEVVDRALAEGPKAGRRQPV